MFVFQSLSRRTRWLLAGLGAVALVWLAAWWFASDHQLSDIPRLLDGLNRYAVLAVSAIMPLVGFPVGMIYLVLGARFGPYLGLALVAAVTTIHLFGTHWITRSFLRRPLARWMERHRHHMPVVPKGENAAISLMVMLAPAVPYFIRNYALALSGIPLRVYFGIALPIHLLRSYVALFIGDFGSSPSRKAMITVGVFYAVKLSLFAAVAWWLRKRHKRIAAARTHEVHAP